MRIKPLAEIVAKWLARASIATSDYEAGIRAPRRPWQAATSEASGNYKEGIMAAIADDRFRKGVEKVSDAEWADRATKIGAPRFAPGVRASQDRYSKGFAPFHSALAAALLPPRGPTGSEMNFERSAAVGRLLHSLRISGTT